VIGIDISKKSLEKAKEKAKNENIGTINFLV
jgi:ubiquinone/menaquinone biosynthesis C-methylase UbiE